MISAREEESELAGSRLPSAPVEVVPLDAKDTEAGELITKLIDIRRKSRCKWSDCAVLYRTHVNRDQLAAELARQGIPFTIENMDVMDTPEARDLFACLGAVVSDADGASLFRVAALPQFAVGPGKINRIRCAPESRRFPAMPALQRWRRCLRRSRAARCSRDRAPDSRGHCQDQRQGPRRRGYPGTQLLSQP